MKKLLKNQKVYIISKSYGDSFTVAENRHNTDGRYNRKKVEYKTINIRGENVKALIGYFLYTTFEFNTKLYVLDYIHPAKTGDFYLENDFLTEYEMNQASIDIKLPDSLFEI